MASDQDFQSLSVFQECASFHVRCGTNAAQTRHKPAPRGSMPEPIEPDDEGFMGMVSLRD